MKSVNKVILLGHVTRDSELKATPSGKSVCTFGLATNRVWKDANGDKQSAAEFHTIVTWGALADFCGQYIQKGKPLYIEGHLKTSTWEKPEGLKHFRTEVIAENVTLLGSRDDADAPIAEEADVSETEQIFVVVP